MVLHDIRFGLSLTISAALYIGTLVTNGVFVNIIRSHDELKPWFLPYLGLFVFPIAILHIVSAVLFLTEKGDNASTKSTIGIAVIHLLQLGFFWRHIDVFREVDLNSHAQGQNYIRYLQLVFTFLFLLPLLLIQSFIVVYFDISDWIYVATILVTFFATCWFLATFRVTRRQDEYEIRDITCLSFICRLVWRFGEITSRILCLTLFASIYFFWIFLILGLHGLIMFICLCTNFGLFDNEGSPKTTEVLKKVMISFMYIFCFINFGTENTTFRYAFFYLVMFLENIVISIVWYLHSDTFISIFDKNVFLLIAAVSFIVGMVCLVLYKNCFHSVPLFDSEKEHFYENEGCINCRLSLCSKHSFKMQRPFSAGYFSQYQKAVSNGQYFKNLLEDKYIDSDTESAHEMLNSSGEHWQIRDTDLESLQVPEKKMYTAVQASGTYTHKRFFDSDSSIARMTDTDSISSGSGVYEKDWRQTSETILSQLSTMDALSLVSSRTQLLTDSWDNLLQENSNSVDNNKNHVKIDLLNSLIRKDHDTSFFSDGYTTDHTLDSYQLPVTVLAKKRLLDKKKVEPAYSTASDSTDCTICAFMRQNQSSPEESRRNFKISDRIPEDTEYKFSRKKRREYKSSKSASKHKNYVPKVKNYHNPEEINTHKYEKAYARQRRRDLIRIADSTSHSNHRQSNMPVAKHKLISSKTDYSSSVADTSVDENKPCSIRNSDISGFVHSKGNNSVTFSDSDDSAFPRNTPVSDWSGSTRRCTGDKMLYALPLKQGKRDKLEQYKITRNPPTNNPVVSENVRVTPIHVPNVADISQKLPLRAYLEATDNDKDGSSESSCEMII